MTAQERKALAASLTPEEREKFITAYNRRRAERIIEGLIAEERGVLDIARLSDEALTEATKDRPKEPELGPFVPVNGAESWFVSESGRAARSADWFTLADATDRALTANGSIFPTKEAAEREARYTRAHRRLRQIAAVLNAKPTETLGNTRYGFRLGRDCGVVVTTTGFGGMIGGAVTFNHRDDAERAMRQLESEGISLTDLFPED